MTLTRYLLSRLCMYFFLLNGMFALLYNIVEFFEKIVRVQQTTSYAVLTFIALNVLPTFFNLVPLGSFLATCLFVREIYERGEWETIFLMGIPPRRIIKVLAGGGIILSLISFVGKEMLVLPLTQKAESIKLKEFKGDMDKKLYDQWFVHDNNIFTHFSYLDLKKKRGENISILYLSPSFTVEKSIVAPTFFLDPLHHTIKIPEATEIKIGQDIKDKQDTISIRLPDFFAYLTMHGGTLSLKQHIYNLITAHSLSSKYPFNQELGSIFERILKHLQPFFYVTIIFCLFFLCAHIPYVRWAVILAPYPFFVISTSFCTFLIHHNASAFVVVIPYLIALISIILFMHFPFFKSNKPALCN